jgi:hypothetical protein
VRILVIIADMMRGSRDVCLSDPIRAIWKMGQ